MKTSYALWMPVLLDGELKLICEDIRRRLCDSPDLGGFDLSCEIDKLTRDITIRYKVSRHFFSKKKQIILHKENENKYGFITYSFYWHEGKTDAFTASLKENMPTSVYHLIKDFYHVHTDHDPSHDSLLQAFTRQGEIDLDAEFDDIRMFYLRQYWYTLKDFTEQTLEEFDCAKRNIERIFNVQKGIGTLAEIIDNGNNVKGQLKYMDYLLQVNPKCVVPKVFRRAIQDKRKEMEEMLYKVSADYGMITAGLGVRYGRYGIYFGLAGIIVSIVTFVASFIFSGDDDKVRGYINDAEKRVMQSDSLNYKIIQEHLNRIHEDLNRLKIKK